MAIVTRTEKGSVLSHAEMDNNFTELRDRPNGQTYPKASGIGIKVDTATPTWSWREFAGIVTQRAGASNPTANIYRGNIRQYQFAVGNEAFVEFHVPHDYVPNTDLYIHVHWSHNSASVTSGSCTWNFEAAYAKGFDQGAFSNPVSVSTAQNASTIQYRHMITEVALSAPGGTGGLLDTNNIEVDGMVLVRLALTANAISAATDPFFHSIDIHYQCTNLGTKQKAPNFYV